MNSHQIDEESIFHLARQIDSAAARSTYLGQICAGDAALRDRVDALLNAHEHEQEFLKSAPADLAPTEEHTRIQETSGSVIGRYKLLQQLGEGGMGTVFMAEQTKPVSRRVALKIIKPGMDSKAVIARFEAERQALAMMDHPNIAKVLDAGTTDSGRPFFVMELVKGVPITEYCDDNKLTIQQRLELFIEVCRAVQHAHQKGIIHRDIKPSNVLVALYDGKPVPKIIDFGVAKAISQRLTERTMFTQYGQIVGTLEYMSPEQAQFNQLDIDTRSDIYSLGVLLYELLTGVTPFDGKRLRSSAYEEVLRILKEEEPPKPSKRISTLGEDAIAISNSRASQPEGLGRVVRGDLDWVVMKALEKDRTSRYETANAFGEDLCRYLNDEAVHARSPSLAYKVRKFVRRNRVGVSVSTILLLLLVIGTIATVWGFVVLRRKNRQLADLYFVQALEAAINGNESTAQAVVQEATKLNVLSDAQLEMLKGQRFLYTGKTNLAFEHLEAAILMQPDAILPHAMLATAYALGMGVQDPGKPLAIAESLARQKKRLEPLEILFLGQAQYYFHDTKIGLKTLASLPEDFQSPLADAIWADGLTHQANEEGDLVVIEDALKRLDRVQAYMPQNAYVAMVHVWAHTIALRLLDPSDERTPVLRDRGLKAASELERHSEFPVARGVRLMFLLENAPDLALASVRERLDDSNWHVQGAILYASGDREYINRLLAARDRSAWMNQNAVAFTLGFDDRHSETVRQVYSQLKGNRERDAKWYLPEAFLLLQGDDDFRISECHARLDERLAGWDELAIKFVGQCGVSEQEFLEGSVTRRQRGRARLILGLWHMRAGNLSDAKRHLQECVKVKYGIQFYWADAYLARMASDDGWPAVRGARTRSN